MMMFWSVRRRPSLFRQILRSALVIGAAVCVPVSVELARRVMKSRDGMIGSRRRAEGMEPRTRGRRNGHRRRRALAGARA